MAYNYPALVDFGPLYSGLTGTIGYQLYNADGTASGSRVTAGIIELGTGTGIYHVQLSLTEGWEGSILWDTGGASPVYAIEDIRAVMTDDLSLAAIAEACATAILATPAYKLVTDSSGAVATDAVSRAASKNTASEIRTAVGLATANLDTQLGAKATSDELAAVQTHGDSTWATATGFSTHSASDVVTALGTGSTLTALASPGDAMTLSGISDANLGKLEDILDGTGAPVVFSKVSIAAADANGALRITNSLGNAIYASTEVGSHAVIQATHNSAVAGDAIKLTATGGSGINGTLSSSATASIWAALTSAMSTAGSVGKKLADWILGSDNMVKVSADEHTSGLTVKAVTDAVVTDTASRTASRATASEIRGAVGLATANLDTQLAGISEGIGGTGTGARTVVIIVNDGTTALESASVRLTKGAETYVSSTNASGQISFSLDDGTWSVAITLAGYTFAPTTLVVDGDKTQTYSMMLATVTPSEVSKVTGYWYTLDEEGEVEASVDIELRVVSSSLAGTAHDAAIRTETSDSNGLVQFTNLVKGAKYEARRGTTTRWTQFTVPTTATTPYALPDIWGSEEG